MSPFLCELAACLGRVPSYFFLERRLALRLALPLALPLALDFLLAAIVVPSFSADEVSFRRLIEG
jgi:hypothetical protein